jgi:acetolactate synthase-1/2/3 large subunit
MPAPRPEGDQDLADTDSLLRFGLGGADPECPEGRRQECLASVTSMVNNLCKGKQQTGLSGFDTRKDRRRDVMRIYGGGLVVRTLKKFGIEHLFSLPGHQILSVFDACQSEKVDLITTRHEASAVYMAQGLSFARREPGAVILAGGPELTNALTAIAQAYNSKTPLVVVSGSNTLPKRDRGFPQDMDQIQFVRPFTKWARSCHDVRRIPEYLDAAYRQALRGRPGPVYVEIPYDVMESRVDPGEVAIPAKPVPLRACGTPSALEAMARLLEKAKSPVAIAGSGVFWSRAEHELQAFIEKTQIPLFMCNAALVMPFAPQAVFGKGSLGISRTSTEAVTGADLILLLGTRVNFNLGFGQPPFITEGQKIVQIDVEPEEIGSNRPVDLGIEGDIRATLEAFNRTPFSRPSLDRWRETLQKNIAKYEAELGPYASSKSVPIHPYRLVTDLEAIRSDDSMLVLDGANSILWALLAAKTRSRGGLLISCMGELQAIGAGVPLALGFKLAHPDRQVILHTGDGSFGYGLMEMETAVRHSLPIVVVVHNDKGWGMTRDMQVEFFRRTHEIGNELGLVHYEKMIEALGGHGELVERPEAIHPAIEHALQSGLPACVNVVVDPGPKSPGLITFFMMEVMLGKQTYYDKIPEWIHKLRSVGLDEPVTNFILRYLDRQMHKDLKG